MMQGGPHGAGGIAAYIIQRASEQLPTVVNLRRDVLCAAGALCPCGPAPGQWPIAHCARSAVEGYQRERYPGPWRWNPEGTTIVCRSRRARLQLFSRRLDLRSTGSGRTSRTIARRSRQSHATLYVPGLMEIARGKTSWYSHYSLVHRSSDLGSSERRPQPYCRDYDF